MSKRHKKVSTTLNYVWKRGRDRAMLLFPNVTNRLEKPMRKAQVNNFTTVNFLKKNKSKQALKPAEGKGTQDLFGRLLFLSFQQKIDVPRCASTPLCLKHIVSRIQMVLCEIIQSLTLAKYWKEWWIQKLHRILLLYSTSIIVSLCKKLSCLLCLIYALMFMNLYQRHKKTQKGRKRNWKIWSRFLH